MRDSVLIIQSVVLLFLLSIGWASEITPAQPAELPPIEVIPQDGFNLKIDDQISDHRVVVRLDSDTHNFFGGCFTHLPTDGKSVIIGFSMDAHDNERNMASVGKWVGLRPVMTYADVTQYTSYEWFQKDDQGRWISGDPFKQGKECFAGTGRIPIQQALPVELTEQCLSPDGRYWSPWCEVEQVEASQELNLFRVIQHFNTPTATLAIRVPFTGTFLKQFTERLEAAHRPGVFFDNLGQTPQHHDLSIIRMEPPVPDTHKILPTIFVYAREHATEPDGSWGIFGMVRWLLSDEATAHAARQHFTWLFLPILDQDAAARADFRLGEFFQSAPPVVPEAVAIARYLIKRIDAGCPLYLTLNLHNLECSEGPNIVSPMINSRRSALAKAFNAALFQRAAAEGFTGGDPVGWVQGMESTRLAGWCFECFHTFDMPFEFNSRSPASRLTLQRTEQLGAIMAQQCANFASSEQFLPIAREIDHYLSDVRPVERSQWWTQVGHDARHRTPIDLFSKGY